jgi:hypothetical protein
MSSETPVADTEDKELSSAESRRIPKILQNPQLPRNNEQAPNPVSGDSSKPQTEQVGGSFFEPSSQRSSAILL